MKWSIHLHHAILAIWLASQIFKVHLLSRHSSQWCSAFMKICRTCLMRKSKRHGYTKLVELGHRVECTKHRVEVWTKARTKNMSSFFCESYDQLQWIDWAVSYHCCNQTWRITHFPSQKTSGQFRADRSIYQNLVDGLLETTTQKCLSIVNDDLTLYFRWSRRYGVIIKFMSVVMDWGLIIWH